MKTNETTGLPEFCEDDCISIGFLGLGKANRTLKLWLEKQPVIYGGPGKAWTSSPNNTDIQRAYLVGIHPIEQESAEKILKDIIESWNDKMQSPADLAPIIKRAHHLLNETQGKTANKERG